MRTEVSSRAGFDPLTLVPIESASQAVCPAFFGVASDDTFVLPHHTQDLHDAWVGERVLRVFDGGHNGVRPDWFLEEAADFLIERMRGGGLVRVPDTVGPLSAPDQACQRGLAKTSRQEAPSTAPQPGAPVTRRFHLDSGVEGEHTFRSLEDMLKQVPAHKHSLATELAQMGIGFDSVFAATKECSTLEESVQWVSRQRKSDDPSEIKTGGQGATLWSQCAKQSGEACAASVEPGVCRGAHTAQGGAQAGMTSTAQAKPATFIYPTSTQSKTRLESSMRVGGGCHKLAEDLVFLGFEEALCEKASHRCLTLEAAIDYLSSEHVTVHL